MKEKAEILETAAKLCAKNDCHLLYLTIFGSILYGTETEKSDMDVRGIFMPSLKSLALGRISKSLHFSTGQDDSRNQASDVDIDLCSIQRWLLDLLPVGDIGAMDLLFSPSNARCVLKMDSRMEAIFANPLHFLNLSGKMAYADYCIKQAKKYGIRGSRKGTLKNIWKWLEGCDFNRNTRLGEIIPDLLRHCGDERFCHPLPDSSGLELCGKTHTASISVSEFRGRIAKEIAKYDLNEGKMVVDYKALSHAFRALEQMEQLFKTGKIIFPLAGAARIKYIKSGAIPWPEIESVILEKLEKVDELREKTVFGHGYDRGLAVRRILDLYGLE